MTTGVEAIDKLRLYMAFGENLQGSWTIRTDSRLLVVDDITTNVSRFSDDNVEEEKALVILNPNNKLITLLSIDHQLVKDHPGGIADCAVLDEVKIDFIEFKTNAYGNSEQAIMDTFEKATSQLKETLKVFKSKLLAVGIELMDVMIVECRIIVSHRFPRATAAKQNYRAAFGIDTDGVNLLFERLVVFD